MGKAIVQPTDIFCVPDINLNKYISIPSTVHGYSLAIEYMRDWFLSNYPKDFFKTVHIGGKHVFADYRKFNKNIPQQIIKPAVAINPSLNTDYNREMVDLVQGGLNIYTRRSSAKDDRFFIDKDCNINLAIQMRELEMPFNIKIRVRTRSQQLDLLEYTRVACRIGSTQTKFVDIDCHIPYDIILAVAMDTGFELIKDDTGYYHIKDIVGFLSYMNSHSRVPVVYKLRTINGRCEFFIRLNRCYAHISCLEGISIDDGEREGSLENNYHIEFAPTLHFSVPALYSYYSMAEHRIMNKEIGDINALYQIISVKPPEVNERGWHQYLTTQWIDDSNKLTEITFQELLDNGELQKVLTHTVKIGLDPSLFMDVKVYNAQREIPIKLDWKHYKIIINQDILDEVSDIAIYADIEYINTTLANLDAIDKDRLRLSEKQQ